MSARDDDAILERGSALEVLRARLQRLRTASTLRGLAYLTATFGLGPFERDVLLLAAGCELDARFTEDVARAHDDPVRRLPTLRLALAVASEPIWEILTPDAPLRRYALIELLPSASLVDAPYRVAERVLHALLGVDALDVELAGLLGPLPTRAPTAGAGATLTPTHERSVASLTALWSTQTTTWPVLALAGDDDAAKRAVATEVAQRIGLRVWRVNVAALTAQPAERERLSRLCEREAALSAAALVLELGDELEPAERRTVLRWVDELRVATVVCAREHARLHLRDVRGAEIDRPTTTEQRALWETALPATATVSRNGQLDRLVAQFSLDAESIARIGGALADEAQTDEAALWRLARQEARASLDELATRLPSGTRWNDLVLPEQQMIALREIVAQVRQRNRVYQTWGFERDGRGLGVTALFAGPSGTGKTLAAEIIANELGLDGYRIDLSQVVSKYIGETEKNLRRVFDAAEAGGAVLLFDEADAIFGKRTDVRDSHDRYANIEVSYLLQRMESYRGLAILTTSMKSAIDAAFLRRLRFVIDFPFPDAKQRAAIWGTIFPEPMPREELDLKRLAQLNVTGGNIRNIALHAAFVAADEDAPVRMAHLLRAARTEYAKLDRPLSEAELHGWPQEMRR